MYGNNRRHSQTFVQWNTVPIPQSQGTHTNRNSICSTTSNENILNSSTKSKKYKSLNYIEKLLIQNFEEQCNRHFNHRFKNISNFFIIPDIEDVPLYVVKASVSPTNAHLPLSNFYHADQNYKKIVSKINEIHPKTTHDYSKKILPINRKGDGGSKNTTVFSLFLTESGSRDEPSFQKLSSMDTWWRT